MPLLLCDDDVRSILRIEDTLEALDAMYGDLVRQVAINRARTHTHLPTQNPEIFFRFKSMEGGTPCTDTYAVRVIPDHVAWPYRLGKQRQEKVPAQAGKWLALILLFRISDGQLLAIITDGVLQRMRVGATSGIAARHLSREDSAVVGLIGSGGLAGPHLLAYAAVRPIKEVRVYSLNAENCSRFARQMSKELGIDVTAVDHPEKAVRGADIVATATNAFVPVIEGKWLSPGTHVSGVQVHEWDDETYGRCDVLLTHANYGGEDLIPEGMERSRLLSIHGDRKLHDGRMLSDLPVLTDLIARRVSGRSNDREITGFMSQMGLGTQFSAVGARLYQLARERGIGRELPDDWFLQDTHT